MWCKAALAVGKFPWEIDLTHQQLTFLMAMDAVSLLPDPALDAWKSGMSEAPFETYRKRINYIDGSISVQVNQLVQGATEIGPQTTVSFE